MGKGKISDNDVLAAQPRVDGGEPVRRVARELGVSHVALMKRLAAVRPPPALPSPRPSEREELGGYTALEVGVIVAVADAGLPGGLELMAEVFGGSLLDVVAVAKRGRDGA